MKRRHFLTSSALFSASSLIAVGSHAFAFRQPGQNAHSYPKSVLPETEMPRLIVVFLRGAADGLNVVVPHQDPAYYDARPTIAIAPPGNPDGVLDLDGYFGLHPALIDLLPQWQSKQMAFVHGTGLPNPIRSHFEAQNYMENGISDTRLMINGWMNRLLGVQTRSTPTQAIEFGNSLSFSGKEAVTTVDLGPSGLYPAAVDFPAVQKAFDRLYGGTDDLSQMYRSGRITRALLSQELNQAWLDSIPDASELDSFSRSAQALAQLMVGDAQTQVAFMELNGWDTHTNERKLLHRNLTSLNDGLAFLCEALGDLYYNTTIVVLSEFGRTVEENGSGGTDHGHGTLMMLLGGQLKGGQMYGNWSSLAESNLHEGRDLPVTTDFRVVLSSILKQQWGLTSEQLAHVFPHYQSDTELPFWG